MSKPWEIVMQFKERLKQGTTANPLGLPVGSTSQQLKPFVGEVVSTRLKKVKDIVNETYRVIEESKPQPLNTTVSNFCQNCTCAQCSHQKSVSRYDADLNTTLSSIVKSYESFLEMQRQQFMSIIGELSQVTGHSLSVGDIGMQQSCAVLPLQTTFNKGEQSSGQSLQGQEFHSPTSTVNEDNNDDCSSTCTLLAEDKDQRKSTETEQNLDQIMDGKRDECIYSCDSFDDYYDENFKPVRKSLTKKYKDCSVILHKLNDSNEKSVSNDGLDESRFSPLSCQKQCSVEKPQNNRPTGDETLCSSSESHFNGKSKIRDKHEKEKLMADMTFLFADEVPKPVTKTNIVHDVKPKTTRSGRIVQNPGQFWIRSTTQGSTRVCSGIQPPQPIPVKRKRRADITECDSSSSSQYALVPVNTTVNRKTARKHLKAQNPQEHQGRKRRENPRKPSSNHNGRKQAKSYMAGSSSSSEDRHTVTSSHRSNEKVPVVGRKRAKIIACDSSSDSSMTWPTVKETAKSRTTRRKFKEEKNTREHHENKRRENSLKPISNRSNSRKEAKAPASSSRASKSQTSEPNFQCYFEEELNDTWDSS